jgi:rare lipoprotein A (peptidoglycan hydrolase)
MRKQLEFGFWLVVLVLGALAFTGAVVSAKNDPPPATATVTVTVTTTDQTAYLWMRGKYRAMKHYARAQEQEKARLFVRIRALRRQLGGIFGMTVSQASWYGPGFYGQRTACGLTLTEGSVWVAHRSLACGTRLVICASRCAHTFVGDRGPYVAGREFDLAPGLKAQIGFGSTGPVRWRIA